MRGKPAEIYLRSTRAEVQPTWAPDHAEPTAAEGSSKLRQGVERSIFKFAFRHGISRDEARILLLNTGVKL